jgi:hypothetical protein
LASLTFHNTKIPGANWLGYVPVVKTEKLVKTAEWGSKYNKSLVLQQDRPHEKT